jgi:hypothetical protein
MSVYVLGTGKNGTLVDYHRSVLQARLAAIWGADHLRFHGDETAEFTAEDCAGLLVAGGTLPANPEDVEDVRRYATAMHWFSDSLAGITLATPAECGGEKWQGYLSALNDLNIITVPDAESANILRLSGVQSAIFTCADLAYLSPLPPLVRQEERRKPVLGVFAENNNEIARAAHTLENEFEVRYISAADFAGIDICLTARHYGVVLSVLREIPFAVIDLDNQMIARECKAIGYPTISDVRNAWSERVALRELLHEKKRDRVRLARRNIELVQVALSGISVRKAVPSESGRQTLLVWAAPDEYWDETKPLLARIGPGFDCLVPSSCHVSPAGCRKRLSLRSGTLMHWAMLPEDLKREIENGYENVVVCHAYATNEKTHLADLAARTGRQGWEFRLWTHSCESYS